MPIFQLSDTNELNVEVEISDTELPIVQLSDTNELNLEIEISDTELPIFQLSDTNELNYKNFDILAVLKKQRPLLSQIREQNNSDLNKPKAENRDPELKFQRCCKYVEGVVARRQWI